MWAESCTFMKKGYVRKEEGFKDLSSQLSRRYVLHRGTEEDSHPWGCQPGWGQHQTERNGLKCWEFLKGSASNFGTKEFGLFLLSLKLLVWP